MLSARAWGFRQLATLGFALHNLAQPVPPSPSSSKWIDSTLAKGKAKGKQKIKLDIWDPRLIPNSTKPTTRQRPCVLVFHGGGFILGDGTDDSRWAMALLTQLGAVVIAVNYRLAPASPFPIPVQDSADAILHILSSPASEYGIDKDKIILSGFSAGANLVFSSWILIRQLEQGQDNLTELYPGLSRGDSPLCRRILGIVSFYPLLDRTIPRDMKRARSVRPQLCLPPSFTDVCDQAYLSTAIDMSDPLLSPSLADDCTLKELPDVHLCCCEYDMLYAEAMSFRDRLDALRKVEDATGKAERQVSWRLVKGQQHAFDKPPPVGPKRQLEEEYDAAISAMKIWLER